MYLELIVRFARDHSLEETIVSARYICKAQLIEIILIRSQDMKCTFGDFHCLLMDGKCTCLRSSGTSVAAVVHASHHIARYEPKKLLSYAADAQRGMDVVNTVWQGDSDGYPSSRDQGFYFGLRWGHVPFSSKNCVL